MSNHDSEDDTNISPLQKLKPKKPNPEEDVEGYNAASSDNNIESI